MSADQNDDQKPRIVPPATTSHPATSAAASSRPTLLTETFEIPSSPTLDEVIRTMARAANFFNLLAAEMLRARIVTASNPAPMAVLNASAALEQGALAQRQQMAMQAAGAAGQFAAPGSGPGGAGGAGGPGMPPFRTH